MSYGLGVDLGTTYTAAAVSDASGTRAIPLGHGITVPSVVFVTDEGELITGDAAEEAAKKRPQRASRAHKRRLADPMPLTVGGAVRSPALLMATQLRDAVAAATAIQGCAPRTVVLTCPAVWGPYRREHFSEVPRLAGLGNGRIITEPEAAAMHYSVERRFGDGEIIGVYDLGGGTFDATVLRARQQGMEILGTPEGVERLGGIDFDDSVLTFVDSKLGGVISELDPADPEQARLLLAVRETCRQAKEALSTNTDTVLELALPGGTRNVKVSRNEFNELIRPHLDLTTDALTRTISSAGLSQDDLAAVLLAGGSSRIPLVAQTVSEVFGKPVRVGLHPKITVALGAAVIARADVSRPRTGFSVPPPPPPPPATPPMPRTPPPPGAGVNPQVHFVPGRSPVRRTAVIPPPHRPRLTASRRVLVIAAVVATAVLCAGAVTAAVLTGGLPDPQQAGATQAGATQADKTDPGTVALDNAPPPANSSTGPAFLRDGQDVTPFHSMIGSDTNWAGSAVSPAGNAAHAAISVRPADVNAKGDGRHVTWTGGAGQFYLQHPQGRLDARPYLESGVLAFDVVVSKTPAVAVSLAMHCHHPCVGELNATSVFTQLPLGKKTTLRIPLACFTAKGLDPANVDIPFLVYSTGAFEATFAQVRWEPSAANGTEVTPCTSLP
jgi:actin-like ATPase involved in cell morphogenesis